MFSWYLKNIIFYLINVFIYVCLNGLMSETVLCTGIITGIDYNTKYYDIYK